MRWMVVAALINRDARSGWRSNGQRDVNMCQKSLYSWVDVTAVLLFFININIQAKMASERKVKERTTFVYSHPSEGVKCWSFCLHFVLPEAQDLRSHSTSFIGWPFPPFPPFAHVLNAKILALFLHSTPRTSLRMFQNIFKTLLKVTLNEKSHRSHQKIATKNKVHKRKRGSVFDLQYCILFQVIIPSILC